MESAARPAGLRVRVNHPQVVEVLGSVPKRLRAVFVEDCLLRALNAPGTRMLWASYLPPALVASDAVAASAPEAWAAEPKADLGFLDRWEGKS